MYTPVLLSVRLDLESCDFVALAIFQFVVDWTPNLGNGSFLQDFRGEKWRENLDKTIRDVMLTKTDTLVNLTKNAVRIVCSHVLPRLRINFAETRGRTRAVKGF